MCVCVRVCFFSPHPFLVQQQCCPAQDWSSNRSPTRDTTCSPPRNRSTPPTGYLATTKLRHAGTEGDSQVCHSSSGPWYVVHDFAHHLQNPLLAYTVSHTVPLGSGPRSLTCGASVSIWLACIQWQPSNESCPLEDVCLQTLFLSSCNPAAKVLRGCGPIVGFLYSV